MLHNRTWNNGQTKTTFFFFYFDHAQDMHCTTTTTTIDENKFNYLVDNSSNVLPLDSVLNLSIALYCFNMYIYILKCIIIVELQRQWPMCACFSSYLFICMWCVHVSLAHTFRILLTLCIQNFRYRSILFERKCAPTNINWPKIDFTIVSLVIPLIFILLSFNQNLKTARKKKLIIIHFFHCRLF